MKREMKWRNKISAAKWRINEENNGEIIESQWNNQNGDGMKSSKNNGENKSENNNNGVKEKWRRNEMAWRKQAKNNNEMAWQQQRIRRKMAKTTMMASRRKWNGGIASSISQHRSENNTAWRIAPRCALPAASINIGVYQHQRRRSVSRSNAIVARSRRGSGVAKMRQ